MYPDIQVFMHAHLSVNVSIESNNMFSTYDWVYNVEDNGYRVTGRIDDAIRVKGVWLDIPEIERAMVIK